MKRHAAPIIAAILLLLPVLYVGSYLAMVTPEGHIIYLTKEEALPLGMYTEDGSLFELRTTKRYRYGGNATAVIFCPLEQIDRRVRPGVWAEFIEVKSGPVYTNP